MSRREYIWRWARGPPQRRASMRVLHKIQQRTESPGASLGGGS